LPFGPSAETDKLRPVGGFAPGLPDLALLEEAEPEGLEERLVSGAQRGASQGIWYYSGRYALRPRLSPGPLYVKGAKSNSVSR
jgi:hypothetical protein